MLMRFVNAILCFLYQAGSFQMNMQKMPQVFSLHDSERVACMKLDRIKYFVYSLSENQGKFIFM